jgi:choline monooxygenase
MSLSADAYTNPRWFDVAVETVFSRTWQWVCHVEKVRDPGTYTTAIIADR